MDAARPPAETPRLPLPWRVALGIVNLPARVAPRFAGLRYGGGRRRRLDLYPAGAGVGRPLVVFFYGGGFVTGSRADYRFAGAAFAAIGYDTAVPDYPVFPQARFPEFVHDAAAAVVTARREAMRRGTTDGRVVLAGHSAGAYIAALLAYAPEYLRSAGGDPGDVVGFVGLSGPYGMTPDWRRSARDIAREELPRWTPLALVQVGAPPSLLLHGTADAVIPCRHSVRLARALRAVGTPVDLRLLPDRGHADPVAALSLPARRRADTLPRVSAFLSRCDQSSRARGRPAAVASAAGSARNRP
jgi:acetyl esterase/lipase